MEERPQMSIEEAVRNLVESWTRIAEHSADIAYARRSLYEAYISEGFHPAEALELCKVM